VAATTQLLNYCGNFSFLARYIVHNTLWGTVSTTSVSLNGTPFGNVQSFSDGTVDNSTGVPYFFLAAADPVVQNAESNPWTSLSLSEAQLDCKDCEITNQTDPEYPLCARVTLTGKVNYSMLHFKLICMLSSVRLFRQNLWIAPRKPI